MGRGPWPVAVSLGDGDGDGRVGLFPFPSPTRLDCFCLGFCDFYFVFGLEPTPNLNPPTISSSLLSSPLSVLSISFLLFVFLFVLYKSFRHAQQVGSPRAPLAARA